MGFSFAVTAYREMTSIRAHGSRLRRCISAAVEHPQIDEIVIVNDSPEEHEPLLKEFGVLPKVKLVSNLENLGVYDNKYRAVLLASGAWVINCDSDNYMDAAYLDVAIAAAVDPKTAYCPSFARPTFDYRELIGRWDKRNIVAISGHKWFNCFINTGNQLVHRETFVAAFIVRAGNAYWQRVSGIYTPIPDELKSDSLSCRHVWDANDSCCFNSEWIKQGGTLEVVEGMQYEHYCGQGDESNYVRSAKNPLVGKLADILLGDFKRRA